MRRILLYLFTTVPEQQTSQANQHALSVCRNLLPITTRSTNQVFKRWSTRPFFGKTQSRFLSSSSSSDKGASPLDNPTLPLPDRLRQAFQDSQTDGVVQEASLLLQNDNPNTMMVDAHSLVDSCVQAAQGKKGHTISIINACIAACAQTAQEENNGSIVAPDLAMELVHVVETKLDRVVKPDMLTYALCYSAVVENRKDQITWADTILDKAVRHSKKLAGSSRRKALAAARRKPVRQALDCQTELQALLGADLAVLDETDDFVVLSKPSGIVCSHSHTTTSGKIGKKNADISLVDALLHVNVPLSTINPQAQGLVHRLDRGTSGCTILAKTDRMHALLVTEFFLRNVHKMYQTIVTPVPAQGQGTLNLPVDGRPARSDFRVIKTRANDLAMVEMNTFTGRKHQVRVHAATGLQAPVLLDPVYGADANIPDDVQSSLGELDTDRERFFLHAASLDIARYNVSTLAPAPSFWKETLKLLD